MIAAIIILGIAYIFMGIYGFHICIHSPEKKFRYIYFAVQIGVAGSIIYICRGSGVSPLLFIPLVSQSVVMLSTRSMFVTNGILFAIYLEITHLFSRGWEPIWNNVPFMLAGQVALILFIQMIGDEDHTHAENQRLITELELANESLKQYAGQIEEFTISRERNRIAREIHDGVGHYLTVVNMQVQAANAIMDTDSERAHQILERAMNQTQMALGEIRKSVTLLRDMPDENISLVESMDEVKANLVDSNITIHSDILGTVRQLPVQFEQTLLRTMQEGVQNSIKHAKAGNIWILLDYRDEHKTILCIRDDGVGCEQPGYGFGLMGLKERARLLNGNLDFGNRDEGGFFLEIEVPE